MKHFPKKLRSGGAVSSGTLFIVVFLVMVTSLGFMLIGGQLPSNKANPTGSQVVIITQEPQKAKSNLQLYTFLGITVTPTPIPSASPMPDLGGNQQAQCNDQNLNQEPETFRASDPVPPQAAVSGGQLKVWATDENTPYIAPNEVVDNTTGRITTPGDRTAKDGNGNIIEPRIYIAPDNIASNIHPYYPDYVKGDYSAFSGGSSGPGPAMDPLPANAQGSVGVDDEYVWDVSSLGLKPGTYQAQFVFHDGDDDQGLGCFSILIQ